MGCRPEKQSFESMICMEVEGDWAEGFRSATAQPKVRKVRIEIFVAKEQVEQDRTERQSDTDQRFTCKTKITECQEMILRTNRLRTYAFVRSQEWPRGEIDANVGRAGQRAWWGQGTGGS